MSNDNIKSLVKEGIVKSLCENKNIQKTILESRLSLVSEMIELDEASFIDKARQWFRSKAYGAEQGAKDFYNQNVLVNPEKMTSNPASVEKILRNSIVSAQQEISSFKNDTLKTSTKINNLQERIFDLFGKFFNLLDSLPQEKRGVFERDVMKVVAVFYNVLMEEKKRIEVYLSALAHEVSSQGYDLGKSAQDMATYRPEPQAQVVGGKVVEPEATSDLVGARA